MQFLTTPSPLLGFLIIAASVALSVAGALVVRRRVSFESLKANIEIAGGVFAVVGGLYSVLLAFIIVVAWQQYDEARTYAEEEALRVSTLLRDSKVVNADGQHQLQERLIKYAHAVAEDEWKSMSSGLPNAAANQAYEQIWEAYYEIHPQTEQEKIFYSESIRRLNDLSSLRRARILSSRPGLPPALWIVMVAGGIVVVVFSYMFWAESDLTQAFVVIALSGFISSCLFLILALDYSFSGTMRIEPDAMRSVIETWKR